MIYPHIVNCSFREPLLQPTRLQGIWKSDYISRVCACAQIFEKKPTTVKNFGVWVRYQSRTGYHNMYKEYRDVTLNGAIEQLYQVGTTHFIASYNQHRTPEC
jgi:hypothetical protein